MFQEFEMQESILHKTNARDVFNLPRLKEAGEAVSLNLEREEEERRGHRDRQRLRNPPR